MQLNLIELSLVKPNRVNLTLMTLNLAMLKSVQVVIHD